MYLNIVNNLTKINEIKVKNDNLLVIIQSFKYLIISFEETGVMDYLKNAIVLYMSTMDETINNIRNLIYVYPDSRI